MGASPERFNADLSSDSHDVLMTAYGDLCTVIAQARPAGDRLDATLITRLESATASLRARSESARARYKGLLESLTIATMLVERLEAMPADAIEIAPTRALLRGELRRTLGTMQFMHTTPAELIQAGAVVAASRQRRAALAAAQPVQSPRRAPRRHVNVASRVFDRVAAVARPHSTFGEALVLARA
jgi:hypothetical protein